MLPRSLFTEEQLALPVKLGELSWKHLHHQEHWNLFYYSLCGSGASVSVAFAYITSRTAQLSVSILAADGKQVLIFIMLHVFLVLFSSGFSFTRKQC